MSCDLRNNFDLDRFVPLSEHRDFGFETSNPIHVIGTLQSCICAADSRPRRTAQPHNPAPRAPRHSSTPARVQARPARPRHPAASQTSSPDQRAPPRRRGPQFRRLRLHEPRRPNSRRPAQFRSSSATGDIGRGLLPSADVLLGCN